MVLIKKQPLLFYTRPAMASEVGSRIYFGSPKNRLKKLKLITKKFNTMKILLKYTFLLLSGAVTLHLSAQTPETGSRFIATNTHSIGINLYPVVRYLSKTDSLFLFEIAYKQQVKGKDRAWRIGLLGQFDNLKYDLQQKIINENSQTSNFLVRTTKQFSIGASVGHEWQLTLGKRWMLAAGVDLRYLYARHNIISTLEYESVSALIHNNWYSNDYSHEASLQPFLGINLAITSHWLLNVAFKADFTCSYFRREEHIEMIQDTTLVVIPTELSSNDTNFHFGLLPFQQLNLIYTF
jgi:hypothetical protein